MKLAVLSDLHLSTPGASCHFTYDLARALAALDRIEATHDGLLIAGDLFDLNVGARYLDFGAELASARAAWRPLLERLERAAVAQVYGNNDRHLRRLGVPEIVALDADGARLLMMHGHQFESEAAWLVWLKSTVKWAAAWNQRQGVRGLGEALYRVNALTSRPNPGHLDPLTRRALQTLQVTAGADILICGHTHAPRVEETPWGVYANSGACSFGRFDWLSVDLSAREVTIQRDGLD
ncbi:MAG: hypothetical protein CMH57_10125 [Myxococcales bacterium]|nr:hypothetical protein [Myxococcales bacterium]